MKLNCAALLLDSKGTFFMSEEFVLQQVFPVGLQAESSASTPQILAA